MSTALALLEGFRYNFARAKYRIFCVLIACCNSILIWKMVSCFFSNGISVLFIAGNGLKNVQHYFVIKFPKTLNVMRNNATVDEWSGFRMEFGEKNETKLIYV